MQRLAGHQMKSMRTCRAGEWGQQRVTKGRYRSKAVEDVGQV